MRVLLPTCVVLGLAACGPNGQPVERGPAFAYEAWRAIDTVRMTIQYRDGGQIPDEDLGRAVRSGARLACNEGEDAIADTQERSGDALKVRYFCVQVFESDETISTDVFT